MRELLDDASASCAFRSCISSIISRAAIRNNRTSPMAPTSDTTISMCSSNIRASSWTRASWPSAQPTV